MQIALRKRNFDMMTAEQIVNHHVEFMRNIAVKLW